MLYNSPFPTQRWTLMDKAMCVIAEKLKRGVWGGGQGRKKFQAFTKNSAISKCAVFFVYCTWAIWFRKNRKHNGKAHLVTFRASFVSNLTKKPVGTSVTSLTPNKISWLISLDEDIQAADILTFHVIPKLHTCSLPSSDYATGQGCCFSFLAIWCF